jgi:hypothetical protein
MKNRLLGLSFVLLMVGFSATPALFAKILGNTIDSVLVLSEDGRHITVSGPISCSEKQPLDLAVTVTQRATGAVAAGHLRMFCAAHEQHWDVETAARGDETFEEGDATATAVALTQSGHPVDDAHQWLVNVTLIRNRRLR